MRFLVISEYFIDITNANANCIRVITEELCSHGNTVDVICDSLGQLNVSKLRKPNLHIHPVQLEIRKRIIKGGTISDFEYYKKRIVSVLRKSLVISKFPLQDVKSARALYDKALTLSEKNTYDAVIVAHKTIESVYAGIWLKKKTGLHTVLYELDPLINEIDAHLGLSRVLQPIAKVKEVSLYKKFDLIVHMMCHKGKFETKKYDCLANKRIFLDFPLYEPMSEGRMGVSIGNDILRFICLGTLDNAYRSPFGMIDVLRAYRKDQNLVIDFYTKGNCEKELHQMEMEDSAFIHAYGYVPLDELNKKISETDVLIDIGNKYSDMVPSKIFHMFAYGKPIIHFCLQRNDAAIPYLERYPFALIIPYGMPLEECVGRIRTFIRKISLAEEVIFAEDLNKLYLSNTPQFTTSRIIERIHKL